MNRSSIICVDASLVVRLVVMPADDGIQHLWTGWAEREVVSPSLLFYEVTNAIYQYQRASLLNAEAVESALRMVLSLPIKLVGDPKLHIEARQWADRLGLPATYDAHYLALAGRLDAQLWTADKKLVKAAHENNIDWVKLYP